MSAMKSGTGRATTIILVCSLAVNLLFAGAIIGNALRSHKHGGPMPGGLGWIVRHLDDDTRQTLRPIFETHRQETLPLLREMRSAQQAFETALLDPDVNEQELAQTLSRLRTTSAAFQEAMHEQMVRVISQLGPAERKKVAQYLHQHHPRRPPGERMETLRAPRDR